MSIHKKASLVGTIESLLQAVEAEKTASHTEAGGYEGQSSMAVYGLPADRWKPNVENLVTGGIKQLVSETK